MYIYLYINIYTYVPYSMNKYVIVYKYCIMLSREPLVAWTVEQHPKSWLLTSIITPTEYQNITECDFEWEAHLTIFAPPTVQSK